MAETIEQHDHYPPLPASASHVIGVGDSDERIHAIALPDAQAAVLHQDALADPKWVSAACGTAVVVARSRPAAFARGEPMLDANAHQACARCCWSVALLTHTEHRELAARTSSSLTERATLTRLGVDPTVVTRLCQAALRHHRHDMGDRELAHLLGHLSDHAPDLLLDEACNDGECDHTDLAACHAGAVAACVTCSLIADTAYAGEWAGQVSSHCTVTPPCSVLTTIAATLGVPLAPVTHPHPA